MTISIDLSGRTAIVTGGARGIGEGISRALAQGGARVIVADLLEAEGAALAKELGGGAQFIRHDVTDEAAWTALVAATGPVNILVNNAGILHFATIEETPVALYRRVLEVNLTGAFLGIQAVLPGMKARRKGAIVNISSVDGMKAANGLAAYCSSKWGARGLTRVAAMEAGLHGIRVNSVHPAGIDTIMANPNHESDEEAKYRFLDFPLQRMGKPADIANVVAFLCSDAASFVSGAEITADGGYMAGRYYKGLPGAPE
jgi:3alpha(or 20beta)-hydroxysteroid dehydrogenase